MKTFLFRRPRSQHHSSVIPGRRSAAGSWARRGAACCALWLAVASPAARATTETALYRFGTGLDGTSPQGKLIRGNDGNFYGTTASGGANSNGSIFRITPGGIFTNLHDFTSAEGHGSVAALAQGSDGNFYGTTLSGGTNGDGTVFKVTPSGTLTSLHSFNYSDGKFPFGALVLAPGGVFYGTTYQGGANDCGTVYKITTGGLLTTVHAFSAAEGRQLRSRLVVGTDGNLYGTAAAGGAGDKGTVFRLTTAGVCTVLHSFSGTDGGRPCAGLVQGGDGSFYGTTTDLEVYGNGTVFKMTPAGAFTVLHRFSSSPGDYIVGELALGSDGNFYGTTPATAASSNNGTVFQITPAGAFTTLYSFTDPADGAQPVAGLTQGVDGSFYGTTEFGGGGQNGAIFKITVGDAAVHSVFFTGETALSDGVYYLEFGGGNVLGYYSYLSNPHYVYHFDLGYEYVFDAADGKAGVYLYDFKSGGFFYTSPSFAFPYLYDFRLNSILYYYPDPNNAGHYNTDGVRYFYEFKTGQIITK